VFGFCSFLSSEGLCSYEGAQFRPTVSLSENYLLCADLTQEMPTKSHLVTSSVLRLSASSCKSYSDPHCAEEQLFIFGKASQNSGKGRV